MLDLSAMNRHYHLRRLDDSDADSILELCEGNTLFYQYCEAKPSKEQVLNDLHITPPDVNPSNKYYIGFYQKDVLIAVMDLIDGYPDADIAFIGFFMVKNEMQGNQVGSNIIQETASYLKSAGMTAIQLGIDKSNPQSTHFWKKNGFAVIKEVERGNWTVLVAEKTL